MPAQTAAPAKFINKLAYKINGQLVQITLPTIGIDMTSLGDATTAKKGIVKLNSVPSATDETSAVTPKGVEEAIKQKFVVTQDLSQATEAGKLYFVTEAPGP